MPIYEYQHNEEHKCEETVEVFQKMSDDRLTACPHCGKSVHRIISLPAKGKVEQDKFFYYDDEKGNTKCLPLSANKDKARAQMDDHYRSRGENPDEYNHIIP